MIMPSSNFCREIKYKSFIEKRLEQITNERRKKVKTTNRLLLISGITFLIFALLTVTTGTQVFLILSLLVLFITFVIARLYDSSSKLTSEIDILNSGLRGERLFADTVRKLLPSNHTVFYNYPIPHGDIDALVVGDSGVYAFEVKNIKGYLTIDETGWRRQKVSSGGVVCDSKTGNYELQAKRNAMYIRNLLKENGVEVRVSYFVVFTNDQLHLNVKGKNSRVLHLRDLENVFTKRSRFLSKGQVEKIVKILLSSSNQEPQN